MVMLQVRQLTQAISDSYVTVSNIRTWAQVKTASEEPWPGFVGLLILLAVVPLFSNLQTKGYIDFVYPRLLWQPLFWSSPTSFER